MAVPFMLGNFSSGLFSGAQNIFSLYNEYQGVRRQSALDDIDAEHKKALKQQQDADDAKSKAVTPVSGTQGFPGTANVSGTSGTTPGTSPATTGVTQAPLPPAPTPTSSTTTGPVTPDTTRAAPQLSGAPFNPAGVSGPPGTQSGPPQGPPGPDVATGLPRTATVPLTAGQRAGTEPLPVVRGDIPPIITYDPNNPNTPEARGRMAVLPRAPGALPTHDIPEGGYTPNAPVPTYTAPNDPGRAYQRQATGAQPGTGADVAAHEAADAEAERQRQMAARPSVTAGPNEAIPRGQVGGPYTPPPQQAPASRVPPKDIGPIPPPSYVDPNQPDATPPVGGYLTGGGDPNIPRTQPGGPYIPPRQGQPPAPGGGAPVQGGVPQASAQPPSLGGRLMNMIIPSAQAAEPTAAGEQPGSGAAATAPAIPPPGPVGVNPQAPVQIPPSSTPPPAQPAPAPSAQPTGITPAQVPPGAPVPAHAPPGPVAVAGTGGKVEQSSVTPPVLAPPVDYGPLRRAEQTNPGKLAMVNRAIQQEGAEGLSPAFVAATIERESHWKSGLTHGTGSNGVVTDAQGLMQVIGSTRNEIDPRHELNPLDDYDSIRLGVRYYKQLNTQFNLGYNTVQSAFAYRAGPGRLQDVASQGWDGYARTSEEHRSQVQDMVNMFPGTPLTTSLVPGGTPQHQPYDARAGVEAERQRGPDGLLSHISETGPAGLGMTDRWRGYQSALEHYLIISGHPDQVGMAAEWTAQVSQQGTVSHLMAADQAVLAGNGQLAIEHLAMAHAFFPDGTYARFGLDNKGQIWGYQMLDHTDTPTGKPMLIAHDDIMGQMIKLQNPLNYSKQLQAMQKTNAEIEMTHAHAAYYRAQPGIAEEKQNTARQVAETRAAGTEEAARIRADAQRDVAGARADAAREKDAVHGEHNAQLEAETSKVYPPASADAPLAEGVSPDEYSTASGLYRQMRKLPSQGGLDVDPATAKMIADGLAAGTNPQSKSRTFKLVPYAGKDGREGGYAVVDSTGKPMRTMSNEQGALLRPLMGLAGSAPLGHAGPAALTPNQPPPAAAPGRQTSAPVAPVALAQPTGIGAGAGTYAALQAGYNRDLSGLPRRQVA